MKTNQLRRTIARLALVLVTCAFALGSAACSGVHTPTDPTPVTPPTTTSPAPAPVVSNNVKVESSAITESLELAKASKGDKGDPIVKDMTIESSPQAPKYLVFMLRYTTLTPDPSKLLFTVDFKVKATGAHSVPGAWVSTDTVESGLVKLVYKVTGEPCKNNCSETTTIRVGMGLAGQPAMNEQENNLPLSWKLAS